MTEHTEAANTTIAASAVTDNAATTAAPASETLRIETATSAPADTPILASSPIELPKIEMPKIDLNKIELSSVDRPMADSFVLGAAHIELPKDEPQADVPTSSVWGLAAAKSYFASARAHLPLAASLGIAAVLGALAGAAATAGFTSEPPKPAVETRVAGDDTRALKEMLVRLSSELTALKSSVESANRNSGSQINKLSERLDRAEKAQAEPASKIARIAETVDRLDKRQAAATAPTTVAALQPPAHQDVTGSVAPEKLQAKLPVIEGWKLHEFFGGRAVVENRTSGMLFEVGPGSNLPGVGRIETIRREDNRIVIVTPKGIIAAALDPRRQPAPYPYR